MSIDLKDPNFVLDPRRFAPQALEDVERSAILLAEVRRDLTGMRAKRDVWMAQQLVDISKKYPKWPKWRVDALAMSDPMFRFHEDEVAKAEEAEAVCAAVAFACQQRVKLIQTFYPGGG